MEPTTNIPVAQTGLVQKRARPWFLKIGWFNGLMLLLNGVFAVLSLVMVIGENSRDGWMGLLLFGGGTAFLSYTHWRACQPQPREKVTFDDVSVTRKLLTGKLETIRWDEVDRIRIVTTDEGPFSEDMFWVFENAAQTKGCFIENGAEGLKPLLSHIQTFKGFDNFKVIEASGSTRNAEFVVWTKAAPASASPPTPAA
jgi:hypothetical protein